MAITEKTDLIPSNWLGPEKLKITIKTIELTETGDSIDLRDDFDNAVFGGLVLGVTADGAVANGYQYMIESAATISATSVKVHAHYIGVSTGVLVPATAVDLSDITLTVAFIGY